MVDISRQLVAAGVAARVARGRRGRAMRIRVHGNGPLSDLVVSALRCSGARVRHTNQRGATAADADLAVLTDYLVADPALVRELHAAATPHLLVRVRDGNGLVGPMVVPGVTSCLGSYKMELRSWKHLRAAWWRRRLPRHVSTVIRRW